MKSVDRIIASLTPLVLMIACTADSSPHIIEPDVQSFVKSHEASSFVLPVEFSTWSTPVSLGSPINGSGLDSTPFVSRDGLELYFASNRPGTFGAFDIWVATRPSVDEPW